MSKNAQFQKFINQKSNAARKEELKQDKKAAKKEKAAAIERRFEEKRAMRGQGTVNSRQGAVGGRQSAVGRGQSAADSRQPITRNSKPELNANKPARGVHKPVVRGQQGAGGSRQQAVGGQQSTAGSARAAGSSQQPAVSREQSAADSRKPETRNASEAQMPLNKYIAHSGICSRRDAAELVKRGEVMVNDKVVTEPGTKIDPRDIVKVKGRKITPSRNFVYILLNKPKDYLTTMEDPEGRKTVLDLLRNATTERVYPVGRLDRNTSGVLLLTNDGDLAQTLSHPKHEIKKIYEVRLDKPLTKVHFDKLAQGITLEDGFIAPDALGYTEPKDKSIIGIEIHSGRNRIVRRIFEALGYDVRNLDRVMYAGLTKKNVQRGTWRFLSEKEIRILRHFNPQTKRSKVDR